MKNLKEIIIEKLKIDKNTKLKKKELKDVSNIEVKWKVESFFNAYNSKEKSDCFNKMLGYYNKQSKVSTLINTIKDRIKLVNRWFCAILLGWDEAIIQFKQAILDRELIDDDSPEDQLDGYIYQKCYIEPKLSNSTYVSKIGGIDKFKEALEHYFELENIKY